MNSITQVEIVCPSCNKKGIINISTEALKNTVSGLLAVSILTDIICSHSFMAYIDMNLQVRDYFIADFQVEIPKISSIDKRKEIIIPSKEFINIDLIKLNISATILTYIIKSIFLKQKIVLISDQKFLHNHILKFLYYLTRDSFKIDICIIKSDNYKKNKKKYQNAMIFSNSKIIRNYKNLINLKNLYVEKNIVNNFLFEKDSDFSCIVLKNEISKIYELSKRIKDYVVKEKERGGEANILKIKDELEKAYNIKISKIYLKFLVEITASYFEVSAPSAIAGFFEFL
ncbi:MAG: hypothetical protein ACFFAH_09030 [Promethearchaeota archaeon]